MNKVKQTTADPSPWATAQCPEAWDAGEAQDRFGTMAILRGHHHKQWYYAIARTYQKRTQPPESNNNENPKNKSPIELCTTMIREVWRLFETVWENRNDCLHKPSGIPLSHIDERLNKQLISMLQAQQSVHAGLHGQTLN